MTPKPLKPQKRSKAMAHHPPESSDYEVMRDWMVAHVPTGAGGHSSNPETVIQKAIDKQKDQIREYEALVQSQRPSGKRGKTKSRSHV